ncbi:hypothetical protein [Sharpea azabuensis]|uniref:hypothetical protein n=1 Tax=Sharpea azabuensis TaxID=322505 RepID=UPI0015693E9E|nr:hypothetical protein [Sharpea azabuensis]
MVKNLREMPRHKKALSKRESQSREDLVMENLSMSHVGFGKEVTKNSKYLSFFIDT